jgi:competence protein ComEA
MINPIRNPRTFTWGLIMFKKFLTFLVLFSAMAFAGVAFAAAVDVNKATEAELDSIKGVGPAMSGKIIKERQKAPFKDWTDFINRTKGIGPSAAKRFSAEGMNVGGAPYTEAAGEASNKSASKKAAQKSGKATPSTAATAATAPLAPVGASSAPASPASAPAAKATKATATPSNAATPSPTPKTN